MTRYSDQLIIKIALFRSLAEIYLAIDEIGHVFHKMWLISMPILKTVHYTVVRQQKIFSNRDRSTGDI
jgi:hypothetical protein